MPVMATQTNGETNQAIGALAQILYGVEASWGTHPSAASRSLRILPGESLDQNFSVYHSHQLRPDRMMNGPVIGSQDPGGNVPFELAPRGWNPFLYHLLLPSAITTTAGSGGLTNPGVAPTGVTSCGASAIPAGTYFYKYTALNATGETLPSPASTGVVVSTGQVVTITVTAITGATGYNVYRSTSSGGTYFLDGTTATVTFVDDIGSLGTTQPPSSNTSGSSSNFILKGGTTATPLPIGFSLEKGFMDLGNVFGMFQGCKVDKMQIDFRPDAIASGSFEVIARQCTWTTSSGFSNGSSGQPALANDDPYDGAYIALYEGSQALPVGAAIGSPLGLCNDFRLTVDNAYFRRNGYIIGSTLRQNLKPGTRHTTFSGKFMFQDMSLYNKAINSTNTSIKIVCTSNNGLYSHIFDLPTVRFSPNASSPHITSDGPLEITLAGQAMPDATIGSDIQVTINSSETSITN